MSWKSEQSSADYEKQKGILQSGDLPKHLAIIMDGNGRWAVERNKPRLKGHQQGIETVRDIVKACSQIGVEYLTLYAFSIENWNRPSYEVNGLMKLLERYLKQELKELNENNVRMRTIGKTNSLPKNVQKLLHHSTELTKENKGLNLTLALSYSGRWDIVRAVQMIGLDIRRGKVSPEDIDDNLFSSYLTTKDLPDADFLIRTSGEMRLSNFLLWEMAYGEMYISEKYWPEFDRNDLYDALLNFVKRERRYGKTSVQIKSGSAQNENSIIERVVNAIKNS